MRPRRSTSGCGTSGRCARGGGAGATLSGAIFADGDTNQDQRLTRAEMTAVADAWYDKLDAQQQGLLLSLIEAYASAQAPAEAQARLARVKAGLVRTKFAWMGGLEKGQGHYYRIQGPADLIEYDNTQDGGNHAHSVWRHLRHDWGGDLLRAHYARRHTR